MPDTDEKQKWERYKERELSGILPILERLGFKIDTAQPHLAGERFLMQTVATGGGRKLILLGRAKDAGQRVVIKATSDKAGILELERERQCRQALKKIRFAYQVFFSPDEILFTKQNGYVISIQAFIEQEKPFLERPPKEQFTLVLGAFKAQESAHATTYENKRLAAKNFSSIDASGYLKTFGDFKKNILSRQNDKKTAQIIDRAQKLLENNQETIEQYGGFLTHFDFVPHNIRVADGRIYLLDHSSLRFGNKYEGWARFVNFMILYNRLLEKALVQYVKDNRTEEETLSLKLMRVYRLGEIIWYYINTLDKCSENLLTLNQKRVEFWTNALEAVLSDKPLSDEIVDDYKRLRDSLRSEDEKKRQIGLH